MVWDVPGRCVATFTGDSEMFAIVMAPDGDLIIAGERAGCVHLLKVV
jgi:hypothetical protein